MFYCGQKCSGLSRSITRSPAQKPPHKDLGRNSLSCVKDGGVLLLAIFKLTYAFYNALAVAEISV
ncbi:alpha-galactosidase [Lacticaseibacillus casei]|nr:alpha-galactosidase [Lacticaseibacillus casei]PTU93559.1 alpha-galactosidase [Lacticaseibacillus casei]PTU94222.1 alpha-galactosidase [Lacticaseibacillus casei]RXS56679.1 alpha-galactosidase [Lacticaseibacillus casei]TLF32414.1 alpha-galactosidase [Lacticaseibacillus casei]